MAEPEEAPAQAGPTPPQGMQMLPPQFLPEIVHTVPWSDQNGNAGVALIISSLNGPGYHFWDHDMGLDVARNIKKACQEGSGLAVVEKQLLLPPGVSAPPPQAP